MRSSKTFLSISSCLAIAAIFANSALAETAQKSVSADHKSSHNKKESHAEGSFFESVSMGDDKNKIALKRHGNMFLSGAPNPSQLAALKTAGVLAIADIRQASEDRSELQNAAKEKGIIYENIPLFLPNTKSIDAKAVNAITAFHKKNHDGGHVISCASGNRSSAWFAAHMGKDHGANADKAIAAGKEAFLKDDMAVVVREFLK